MTELGLDGDLAPPMANGEVVFDSPWQARVFGMAYALCERGLYDWDEFRERLIAQIGGFDSGAAADTDVAYRYFDHFEAALCSLLIDKRLLNPKALGERQAEFAARPHGHDHSRNHNHDHNQEGI